MKDVKKEELFDTIGKSQDGGFDYLKQPNDNDYLGKFINSSIEEADEVLDVSRDIDYAIEQLKKAKATLKKFNVSQALV